MRVRTITTLPVDQAIQHFCLVTYLSANIWELVSLSPKIFKCTLNMVGKFSHLKEKKQNAWFLVLDFSYHEAVLFL